MVTSSGTHLLPDEVMSYSGSEPFVFEQDQNNPLFGLPIIDCNPPLLDLIIFREKARKAIK